MKVRKQKLLSMLLCTALTVTSIMSDGFQVSASELQPQPEQQVIVEEATVSESETPETQPPKEETERSILPEETDSTTDDAENGKTEETETGTEAEETAAEETKAEGTETEAEETEAEETETETTEDEEQEEPSVPEEELTEEAGLDAAAEGIASGRYEDIDWKIDAEGKLTVEGTGEFSASSEDEDSDREIPWAGYREAIISAEVKVTGMTDASYMFSGCTNLESVNLRSFDTGSVTDMREMFVGCKNLTSVNLSSFDTSKITDMTGMFVDCSSLQSVDLSSFNTGKVTEMSGMFSGCSSLTEIDLSNFNTENVTGMADMFGYCEKLQSIDLSGFDTSKVTNASGMFTGCIGLTTIYTPRNLEKSVELPNAEDKDIWYQPDGTKITVLPKNLDYSIIIRKNEAPKIEPNITAVKTKTEYNRGETLDTDDLTVTYTDQNGTSKKVTGYTTDADNINMSTSGTKTLTITYTDNNGNNLKVEIEIRVNPTYIVTFNLNGHGSPIAPLTGILANSRITAPVAPTAKDWEFKGWYKDASCREEWNFDKDIVKADITLYAGWTSSVYTQSGNLLIQKIPNASYTGSALKPKVTVYYLTDDGQQKKLTNGKDYTIKYFNNIQADTDAEKTLGGTGETEKDNSNGFTKSLAYVAITCKGNYTGTVYQNFHIDRASIGSGSSVAKGFTLKYTEQLAKSEEPLQPLTSLKYKQNMTAGKDYKVTLATITAYNARRIKLDEGTVLDQNSVLPSIPAGYYGTFLMTVTGTGNYTGTITKTLYVAGKDYLMKNASVMLGKNQKNKKFTGSEIQLTPGWYDIAERQYYYAETNPEEKPSAKAEKKNIFTVRIGQEYLLYGEDFEVSYSNNLAVGTATMTITGIGDYAGVKKVTFHITGVAFNAKNIDVDNFKSSKVFTGSALTQDAETLALTDMSWKTEQPLVYNRDYTISYKNNTNVGTATVIFKGNPQKGYSGSFQKTFKITPKGLRRNVTGSVTSPSDIIAEIQTDTGSSGDMTFGGTVIYTKAGARISDRIRLTDNNTRSVLKEGTDYTVSYSGNKKVTTADSLATMTVTGMGNYKGSIKIYFPIARAPLQDNPNLKVTASELSYNSKKAESSQYRPKIKITDQKKALSASKDFQVEYINCSQEDVTSYLEALADGGAAAGARPYAIVSARDDSNYIGSVEVDLTIYQKKLSANRLYVVVSKEPEQVTFTGRQVRPEVTVYYGSATGIGKAKAAKETDGSELTDSEGKYRLSELAVQEGGVGDYKLSYGANITAGKNKGSVTVIGTGRYSGKVTVKFTVLKKAVNTAGEKAAQKGTVSIARVPERSGTAGVMNADILFSDFRKRYCS